MREEGEREVGREEGRKGGREGERERGRDGGMERPYESKTKYIIIAHYMKSTKVQTLGAI